MIAKIPNVVAVVDDLSTESTLFGLPRLSVHEFTSRAGHYKNALALDFSVGTFSAALFKRVCLEAASSAAIL